MGIINYKLQLSDFQSPATQIDHVDIYSINSNCGFTFAFQMSNAEFMFNMNFNSKVKCSFNKDASALVAPDSSTAKSVFEMYEDQTPEQNAKLV